MMTERIYGLPPVDLGKIDLEPVEMLFWLYCPIKLPNSDFFELPPNLEQFEAIVLAAMEDALKCGKWYGHYAYITAKTLWVTPGNPGNRPGWHSDGFLTDDLNYIWYDGNPTIFFDDGGRYLFTSDHASSLSEMESLCHGRPEHYRTYPIKHLLRLDQRVLHKVDDDIASGMRTFVKVSVSREKYALRGNSINHALAPRWDYADRGAERNCPIGAKGKNG